MPPKELKMQGQLVGVLMHTEGGLKILTPKGAPVGLFADPEDERKWKERHGSGPFGGIGPKVMLAADDDDDGHSDSSTDPPPPAPPPTTTSSKPQTVDMRAELVSADKVDKKDADDAVSIDNTTPVPGAAGVGIGGGGGDAHGGGGDAVGGRGDAGGGRGDGSGKSLTEQRRDAVYELATGRVNDNGGPAVTSGTAAGGTSSVGVTLKTGGDSSREAALGPPKIPGVNAGLLVRMPKGLDLAEVRVHPTVTATMVSLLQDMLIAAASPAQPNITFGPNANQGAISAYSLGVLKDILVAAGLSQATITSTARTPVAQANAMYNNLESNGVAAEKELYASAGDKVIDVYVEQKQANKTPAEIRSAMLAKIIELGPSNVSKHCADPSERNVFDVAPSSISNQAAFKAAVKADSRVDQPKFKYPPADTAFHIEIVQP